LFPADRGPTELHAGDLLGGYRIDRLIGRGGMGSVFLGFDTTLHRSVALKLLDSTEGPGARQRLIR
jgi:serine/threonine-protein kinase